MRVIIAGSRSIADAAVVAKAVAASGFAVTCVLSGRASGVDRLGEVWAEQQGVPIEYFPADWGRFGRAAGPLRNQRMADVAEALIAIWDGESTGTKDMIARARAKGLRVFVYRPETDLPLFSRGR